MKLSIITVNFNDAEGLSRTLESVHQQSFTDFEHLVIDGNSTDGSQKIIQDYRDFLAYWVSEPDEGIYDAMNKGIANSKGEYLLFLNSGDTLYSKSILHDISLEIDNEVEILYGDVYLQYKDRTVLKVHPKQLRFSFFLKNNICHQSMIIKKSLFEKLGYYKLNYKIVADWDFLLRATILNAAIYRKLDHIISIYDMQGISSQHKNISKINNERREVLKKNFPAFIDDYKSLNENGLKISKINKILGSNFFCRLDNRLFRNSIKFSARLFNRIYRVKCDGKKTLN